MTRRPSVIQRGIAAGGRRIARVRPAHLHRDLLWLVILCWAGTAALAALALTGDPASNTDGDLLLRWLVVIGACGIAAASVAAALTLGSGQESRRGRRLLQAAAVVLMAGFPVVALATGGLRIATAASAAGLALAVAAHLVGRTTGRSARARRAGAVVTAVGVLAAWASLQLTILAGSADNGYIVVAWTILLGVSGGFIGLAGFAAVLLVAAPRRERLDPLIRRPASRWVVLGVAMLAVGVVMARLTVANEWFGQPDAGLWTLGHPTGLPHAILTAVVILLVVISSTDRPYRPEGRATVTWILILSCSAGTLVITAQTIVAAFRSAVTGNPDLGLDYVGALLDGAVLTVAGVAPVALFLLGRARPRPIGFAIAAVAIAYTLVLAIVWLIADLVDGASIHTFPFWASPVDVILVLDALIVIRLIIGAIRGEPARHNRAYLAMLVTPVVLMHAGPLIPAILAEPLSAPLVVLGVVLALFWFMPPTAADASRHTAVVLVASAGQLALLLIWLLSQLSTPVGGVGAGETERALGTMFLALPLSVALCAYVLGSPAAAADEAVPTDRVPS